MRGGTGGGCYKHAFPQPPFGNGKFLLELGRDTGVCCLTPGKLNSQPPGSWHSGHLCLDSDDLSQEYCVNPVPRNVAPQLFLLVPCHAFHCSHHETLLGPPGSPAVSALQLGTLPHRGRTVTALGGHHLLPVLLGTMSTLYLGIHVSGAGGLSASGPCGVGEARLWVRRSGTMGWEAAWEPSCTWRAL